jgi:hypothetical protein
MEILLDKSGTIGSGLILLALFFLAWREGVLQKYIYIERGAWLSTLWHWLGGAARGCLIAAVAFLTLSVWWTLGALFAGGLLYNVFINIYKGHKWWYVGTVALTDKIIRKVLFFINFNDAR